MSSILPLKWSAKSSQSAFVGLSEDFLKSVLVKREKVEKRNLGLFLFIVMRLEKWEILACLTVLL